MKTCFACVFFISLALLFSPCYELAQVQVRQAIVVAVLQKTLSGSTNTKDGKQGTQPQKDDKQNQGGKDQKPTTTAGGASKPGTGTGQLGSSSKPGGSTTGSSTGSKPGGTGSTGSSSSSTGSMSGGKPTGSTGSGSTGSTGSGNYSGAVEAQYRKFGFFHGFFHGFFYQLFSLSKQRILRRHIITILPHNKLLKSSKLQLLLVQQLLL